MQTMTRCSALCKSIFKSASPEELSKEFNRKMIELINRLDCSTVHQNGDTNDRRAEK